MKKFRFPLQAALNLAIHREEVEETRLQDLFSRSLELERKRLECQGRLQRTESDRSAKKEILSDDNALIQRYIESLRRRLDELARERRDLEGRIARQKVALAEATRKRRLLDRLRERRFAKYRQEADKASQRESDDLHLTRLAREANSSQNY